MAKQNDGKGDSGWTRHEFLQGMLAFSAAVAAHPLLTGCSKSSPGSGGGGTVFPDPTGSLVSRADVLAMVTGRTYYLDAAAPAGGDGSLATPWNTLAAALAGISSGDCVMVRSGNYGTFNDTTPRTAWTVFIEAEEGVAPVISNLALDGSGSASDLNLIFFGIDFFPAYVDPGTTHPQDPESGSTGHTYTRSVNPVHIQSYGKVRLYNCEMHGYNKHLTDRGISLINARDIVIERCHVHTVNRAVVYTGCSNIDFLYNHLHEICSSAFNDGNLGADPSSGVRIEGNHVHDMNWMFSEDYCPRALNCTYHGSLIALESPNTIIRNNILHDGGPTAGITFYADGTTVFSNILIENNLLYDVHNNFALIVDGVGENVVVRNNIISARGRYGLTNVYKYYLAMWHVGDFAGYSHGLSVYNNVFVGAVVYEAGVSDMAESNNIYWCASPSETFTSLYDESDLTASRIKYGSDDDFFDTGLFVDDFDRSWKYWDVDEAVWHTYTLNSPGHQKTLNLRFVPGAEGINFGDPSRQPSDSLGSLHSSGFILLDGVARDASHHSAGCYE